MSVHSYCIHTSLESAQIIVCWEHGSRKEFSRKEIIQPHKDATSTKTDYEFHLQQYPYYKRSFKSINNSWCLFIISGCSLEPSSSPSGARASPNSSDPLQRVAHHAGAEHHRAGRRESHSGLRSSIRQPTGLY